MRCLTLITIAVALFVLPAAAQNNTTYTYTGNAFSPAECQLFTAPWGPGSFLCAPGNVSGSVTFYNLPAGYTGVQSCSATNAACPNMEIVMAGYGGALDSSSNCQTILGTCFLGTVATFTFQNGSITSWSVQITTGARGGLYGCNAYPGGLDLITSGGPGQGSDFAFRGPPSGLISTITRAGNMVTVDASFAAVVGEPVVVLGVADPSFDGAFTVTQVNSNSEFVYSQTAANATSSGGTVSPPPSCGQVDSNPGVWTLSSGTAPPLQITTPSLPGVASGVAYDAQFAATGGSGGYTWCVLLNGLCDASQSLLPQNFALNESTGLLSTTGVPPATPGPYPFTVQVTDSNGHTGQRDYNLMIACAVMFPNSPTLGVQPFSGFRYGPQYFAEQFVAPNLSNPPSLTALQDYATSCGFTKFEWQQFITSYPAYAGTDEMKHDYHVPNYPSYFPQNVYPALCSGPLVSNADMTVNLIAWASYSCTLVVGPQSLPGNTVAFASPFSDPPEGSFTYLGLSYNPYPYAYPLSDVIDVIGAPFYCTVPSENDCPSPFPYIVGEDGATLSFVDDPTGPGLPGDPASPTPMPGHFIGFLTSLVGVDSQNNPNTLYSWEWNTTFNGTAGGVSQTASLYPIDPGSGTGGISITNINGVPTPTVTVTLSQSTITWAQDLTATVQVTGASGSPTATGSVTLTGGGYTSTPATLDGNGNANITIPSVSLAIGSDPLTVTYTPDIASATTFSQGWGTATLTVSPAVPQIVFAPALGSQTYGTPIAAGSLDAIAQLNGAAVNGTFTYTTGNCSGAGQLLTAGATILQVGNYTITACFTPSNADFAAATATAPYAVTPASQSISFAPIAAQLVGATTPLSASATSGLPPAFQTLTPTVCSVSQTTAIMLNVGTCTIQAVQSGNIDYNPANPVQVSFPVMGFMLTAQPTSETVKRGVLGVFLLKVTSVNGFAGNVSIRCTGGPPNSVCANFPQTVNVKAGGTALALSGILFRPQDAAGTYTITFTGVSGTDTNAATAQFSVK